MVRNKFLNVIYTTIDKSDRFEQVDFNVSESDGYQSTNLVLSYLPNITYTLELRIPKKPSNDDYVFNELCARDGFHLKKNLHLLELAVFQIKFRIG